MGFTQPINSMTASPMYSTQSSSTQGNSTQDAFHRDSGIRYLTNEAGEKTDVLVPVDVWEKILERIQVDSGLDPVDEQEPDSQILADFQLSLQQANQGQTSPISELWEGVDA